MIISQNRTLIAQSKKYNSSFFNFELVRTVSTYYFYPGSSRAIPSRFLRARRSGSSAKEYSLVT